MVKKLNIFFQVFLRRFSLSQAIQRLEEVVRRCTINFALTYRTPIIPLINLTTVRKRKEVVVKSATRVVHSKVSLSMCKIWRQWNSACVHHPGIEPGAPAWKANMLPLHQWCLIIVLTLCFHRSCEQHSDNKVLVKVLYRARGTCWEDEWVEVTVLPKANKNLFLPEGLAQSLPVRHTVESRTTHKKKGGNCAPMYYPRANLPVPFAGHLIVSNCNI